MTPPPPRRRRPPQRGLPFGCSLDRMPPGPAGSPGPPSPAAPPTRPEVPLPIALIGASTPVAPPRITPFGSMAASWPLVDRSPVRPVRSSPAADAATEGTWRHLVGG